MNDLINETRFRGIDHKKYRQSIHKLRLLVDAHKQLENQCEVSKNNNNKLLSESCLTAEESDLIDEEPVRESSNRSRNDKTRDLQYQPISTAGYTHSTQSFERLRQFVVGQEQLLQQLREENTQLRSCYQQLCRHVYRLVDENSTLGKHISEQIMSVSREEIEQLARALVQSRNEAEKTTNSLESDKKSSDATLENLTKTLNQYREQADEAQKREEVALKKIKQSEHLNEENQVEIHRLTSECHHLRQTVAEQKARMECAIAEKHAELTTQRTQSEHTLSERTYSQQAELQQQHRHIQQLESEVVELRQQLTSAKCESSEQKQQQIQLQQQQQHQHDEYTKQIAALTKQCTQLEELRVELLTKLENHHRETSTDQITRAEETRQLKQQLHTAERQLCLSQLRQTQLQRQVNELTKQVESASEHHKNNQAKKTEDLQTLYSVASKREQELLAMLDTVQTTHTDSQKRLENIVLDQSKLLRRAQTENTRLCERLASTKRRK